MKQLLSLLLCFVFLNAQSFAKHEYPGGGLQSITGTYGGVMLPTSTSIAGVSTSPSNSLGLFSFALPQSGFGSGAMLMFANGTVYKGTITAMGDPTTLKITAIINATYDFTVSAITSSGSGSSLVTQAVTAHANGSMKATVDSSLGLMNVPTIQGTATIGISQGEVDSNNNPVIIEQTEYSVTGVQQTTTASTGITLSL